MDENCFFSTALGEWIRGCFCSTSSVLPGYEALSALSGKHRDGEAQLEDITYEKLCDGLTLNRLLCLINPGSYGNKPGPVEFEECCPELSLNSLADAKDNTKAKERTMLVTTNYGFEKTVVILDRLRWFHMLQRLLQEFYQANSLCITSFPNTVTIVQHPHAEISGHEMLKLVGLMLGVAVQSDRREAFIEQIKSMPSELQHELIAEIQRVTTDGEYVISMETLRQLADGSGDSQVGDAPANVDGEKYRQRLLKSLIDCILKDRDNYAATLLDIVTSHIAENCVHQNDEYSPTSSYYTNSIFNSEATSGVATMDEGLDGCSSPGAPANNTASSADKPPASLTSMKLISTSTTSSIASAAAATTGDICSASLAAINATGASVSAVEYAALKAEVRKLRNQNEENEEKLLDLQEDIQERDAQISKLQAERLELVKDARAAKDYRDEVECMQHKIARLERLETENERLTSKLSEVNFYKTRVESLKYDNDEMQRTCRTLDEQLEECHRQIARYLGIEARMIESQANVKSLQLDLTKTREQVEDLLVENGRLERESKQHAQKCIELQRRVNLVTANSPRGDSLGQPSPSANTSAVNDSSLLAQLDACNQAHIRELEIENRRLKAQLENNANSVELFEIRAELIEAKKTIETRAAEKSELIVQLDVEKATRTESDANIQTLRQRLAEAELEAAEAKRTASTFNHEQMEALNIKLANAEQEVAARVAEAKALRDEKTQIKQQLERMCAQQKSSRAEIDRLEEALAVAQQARDTLERARRSMDGERATLKSRVHAADERASEFEKQLGNAEKTLEHLERQLRDRIDELAVAENASRTARTQLEYNVQKESLLREELHSERTRTAGLLERLRAVCASIDVDTASADCVALREALVDDTRLVATIDAVLIRAFNTTRREADALRIQQQMQIRELDDLKRDIESLRKTESELPDAKDKYGEMVLENKSVKQQVAILQERLRRLQVDEATRSVELQAARREIDNLQQKIFAQNRQSAEAAGARAALCQTLAQEKALRHEINELRARLDAAAGKRNDAQHANHALATVHQALAQDHDRLQQLHHALTADYEQVKIEAGSLKQRCKADKTALESTLRAEFDRERAVLEEKLAAETAERQRFFQKLADCEAELAIASRELLELKRERSPPIAGGAFSSTPSSGESHELRRLRLLECAQKSTINNLNMTIQQLNNLMTEKDLEIANLRRQIDMLRQYNGEESRSLIRQIELLLIQNQQLHTRSDVFYAEQKELQEKLAQLRRHKEKLEEKIMDQYKAMDSRKIEAKPTFVRRAARALISKSPGRRASNSAGASPTTRPDGTSSSNTEDSSIYSANEGVVIAQAPASAGRSAPPTPLTVTNKCSPAAAPEHLSRRDLPPHHARHESDDSRLGSAGIRPQLPPAGPLAEPNFANGFLAGLIKREASPVRNGVNAMPLLSRNGWRGESLRCPPTAGPLMKSAAYANRPFSLSLRGILNNKSNNNGIFKNNNNNKSQLNGRTVGDGSIVHVKYNGVEKDVDVTKSESSLAIAMPRALPLQAPPSLDMSARPPPPPYPPTQAPSLITGQRSHERPVLPPPYPGRTASATPIRTAPSSPAGFFPRDTSTPKGGGSPSVGALPLDVVPEGENRDAVRDTTQRQQKAMSFYENVNNINNNTNNNNNVNKLQNITPQTPVVNNKMSVDKSVDATLLESTVLANGKPALWCEYGCV